MEKYIERARVLVEALPYIRRFSGHIVLIKYGGSAMVNPEIREGVMQDIALLKLVGMYPVVIHGGGPAINDTLNQMGLKSRFNRGLRVTDQATMKVVEMVLAGSVNKALVKDLQNHGISAVGISGVDGNTLEAARLLSDGLDLGYVGEVSQVNPHLLKSLLEDDCVPVLAPVGVDSTGQTYNINADYAAAKVAAALKAEKLIYLTDVPGVLKDKDDPESRMARLSRNEAISLINQGIIAGGMVPKVECCLQAVDGGVKSVHVLDGRIEHSLLLEIFTDQGVGSMVSAGEEE